MDLLTAYLTHAVEFLIAAVPLILTFVLLKLFRQPPKVAACCVVLYLPVSVFFWVQLKDLFLVLYQGVPYLSSFVWIWAEHILWKQKQGGTDV